MTGNLAAFVDVLGKVGLIGAVFVGLPFCVYMLASETTATTRRARGGKL